MKLCKDCKHAREPGVLATGSWAAPPLRDPWTCMHPLLVEPVEGKHAYSCSTARMNEAACGPAGALWEQGTPAPSRYADKEKYPPSADYERARLRLLAAYPKPRPWWKFWGPWADGK